MKKIKALTLGSATQDIFIVYEDPESIHLQTKKDYRSFIMLKQGVKIDVKNLHYATGGGATNTAFALKKLGLDVSTCFKISNDKAGNFIKEQLETNGINLKISYDNKVETATSFILPSINKDSTVLAYRGANAKLEVSDIPQEELQNSDLIYITSLAESVAQMLPDITKQANLVAVNPGFNQIINQFDSLYKSFKNIDFFILNRHEAQTLFEIVLKNNLYKQEINNSTKKAYLPKLLKKFYTQEKKTYTFKDYASALLSLGIKNVIVTNGAEGIYLATKDNIYFHESVETEVVSTIGAGDACGSTIIGCLAIGKNIEEAIKFAAINSSSVLKNFDAKKGLLTIAELKERSEKISADLLKKFSW